MMRPLRILFVAPYMPSRLRPRPLHLIRGLAARGHRVSLFALAPSAHELADADDVAAHCERVETVALDTRRALINCLHALRTRRPLQALYCFSAELDQRIRAALAPTRDGRPAFDVLHVEHLRAALYGLDAAAVPRVLDAVDCITELLVHARRHGPTTRSRAAARLELRRTRRFEAELVRRFGRVLVTSDAERRALLRVAAAAPINGHGPIGDERVRVLSHGVDLEHFRPSAAPREPATLVFHGRMAYHANQAAARQLVDAVMPRVWARRPEVRLLLVGADPPGALRALARRAGSRVVLTGYVSDVRPYLGRATAALCPLPYAVGVQNKILEAMAMATPVIATSAACGALCATPDAQLLVGATPEALAVQAVRLVDDPALARRLGEAGRRYVTAQHGWSGMVDALEQVYAEAVAAFAAAPARTA